MAGRQLLWLPVRPRPLPAVPGSGRPHKDREVGVAAKLGRAVEHARLTAHKQVPNLVAGKRRKDFEDRVRDQACLLPEDKIATFSSTPPIAPAASVGTTQSTNPRDRVLLLIVDGVPQVTSRQCTSRTENQKATRSDRTRQINSGQCGHRSEYAPEAPTTTAQEIDLGEHG